MNMKLMTVLFAAFLFSTSGCGSANNTQPANGGNVNKTVSVTDGGNTQKVVTVSGDNGSVEIKQNDSNAKNKVVVTGTKGEKLKVENSADDDDADETSEVSEDSKGSVKTTVHNGKKTTVITDKSGDVVETKGGDKSQKTVIQDGKDNKITVGPNGVILRDRKGNKIVIPQQ